MGVHNIKLYGFPVTATVVDDCSLADSGIIQLMNQLCELKIVGIDVKGTELSAEPQLLLIYVKDRCLIIQLGRMSSYPSQLASFLGDTNICFVGANMNRKADVLKKSWIPLVWKGSPMMHRVEVGELAARVLKNADLEKCDNLEELAKKSGFDFKEADEKKRPTPNWAAVCLSEEEVKCAMREVFISYNVASKLLSQL
ncbi:uncharacterized protein [Coffea arabica]|uniref:3'-5' exonuclease domain-containing protein n=1 Tax=Coffea arabica TaxID=13443 RepID=A0A6P6W5T5_COFAR|nr:uncharacterized protein LOC113729461 [Coffea arabica]